MLSLAWNTHAADTKDEEVDSDDEATTDPHIDFLQRVAGSLGLDVIETLLHGKDSLARSDPIPWTTGDRRLFQDNPLRMVDVFVSARDAAHAKLIRSGYAYDDMEHMLQNELMPTFARLTAYFYRQKTELDDIKLDIQSFFKRHPSMVRRGAARRRPRRPAWQNPYEPRPQFEPVPAEYVRFAQNFLMP